jgi:hypothetical protein
MNAKIVVDKSSIIVILYIKQSNLGVDGGMNWSNLIDAEKKLILAEDALFIDKLKEKDYVQNILKLNSNIGGIFNTVIDEFVSNYSLQDYNKIKGRLVKIKNTTKEENIILKEYKWYAQTHYNIYFRYGCELVNFQKNPVEMECNENDTGIVPLNKGKITLFKFFSNYKIYRPTSFSDIMGFDFLKGKEHFLGKLELTNSSINTLSLEQIYYSYYIVWKGLFNLNQLDPIKIGRDFFYEILFKPPDNIKIPEDCDIENYILLGKVTGSKKDINETYFDILPKVFQRVPHNFPVLESVLVNDKKKYGLLDKIKRQFYKYFFRSLPSNPFDPKDWDRLNGLRNDLLKKLIEMGNNPTLLPTTKRLAKKYQEILKRSRARKLCENITNCCNKSSIKIELDKIPYMKEKPLYEKIVNDDSLLNQDDPKKKILMRRKNELLNVLKDLKLDESSSKSILKTAEKYINLIKSCQKEDLYKNLVSCCNNSYIKKIITKRKTFYDKINNTTLELFCKQNQKSLDHPEEDNSIENINTSIIKKIDIHDLYQFFRVTFDADDEEKFLLKLQIKLIKETEKVHIALSNYLHSNDIDKNNVIKEIYNEILDENGITDKGNIITYFHKRIRDNILLPLVTENIIICGAENLKRAFSELFCSTDEKDFINYVNSIIDESFYAFKKLMHDIVKHIINNGNEPKSKENKLRRKYHIMLFPKKEYIKTKKGINECELPPFIDELQLRKEINNFIYAEKEVISGGFWHLRNAYLNTYNYYNSRWEIKLLEYYMRNTPIKSRVSEVIFYKRIKIAIERYSEISGEIIT